MVFPVYSIMHLSKRPSTTLHQNESTQFVCIEKFICDHLRHMHASYVLWNNLVFTSHGEKDSQLKQLEHKQIGTEAEAVTEAPVAV